jgi:hypothetical protein
MEISSRDLHSPPRSATFHLEDVQYLHNDFCIVLFLYFYCDLGFDCLKGTNI